MFSLILLSALILTWVGTPIRGLFQENSAREQLIYEFTINYKQISRLSLLSCHKVGYKIAAQKQTLLFSETITTVDTVKTLHNLFRAGGVLIKVVPIEVYGHDNTIMERILKSEDHHQVIVLDLSCGNNSLQILQMASDKGLFNSSYHWLLMEDYSVNRPKDEHGDKKKDTPLIEFLTGLNINMNTELMFVWKIDQDQDQADYLLFDVWNPGWQFGGKLNVTEVGRFSQCNGLQMYDWFKRTTTIVRRMDMKNVPIRCMIVVTNKFPGLLEDYLNSKEDTHLDSMHRFNFALLSHIRDMFNFSFRLYHTNSWGYLRNNTYYDGMIGALVRREVDIGGSPAFFRLERAKVIDSTASTWIARPRFIFRHPDQGKIARIIFLRPFSNGVWISLAVCGLAVIILLWSVGNTDKNLLNGTRRHCNKSIEKNPKYYTVFNARPGVGYDPRRKHLKVLKGESFLTDDDGDDDDAKGAERATVPEIKWGARNNRQQTNRSKMETVRTSGRYLRDILCWCFKRSFSSHKSKLSIQGYWSSINTAGKTNCDRSQNNGMIPEGVQFSRSTTTATTHVILDDRNIVKSNSGENIIDEFHGTREIRNRSKGILKEWTHLSRWNFNNDSQTTSSFLHDCILFFVGALCQQGTNFATSLLSGRCIIFSTLLFTFCINQFYSASIVGSLLMEKPKTIKTPRDLIDSSLRVAIEDLLYNRDYFQRTTDPDAIELYQRKVSFHSGNTATADSNDEGSRSNYNNIADNYSNKKLLGPSMMTATNTWRKTTKSAPSSRWYSLEEGLKLMKEGGYAFYVDVATAYKIITETFTEQEICELTEIQLFPPQKMVNIVQKGSPLRKMITYGLRRTTETGLMDRQRKVWHSQKPRCVKQIQPNDLRVGIQTFTSAVFILIFGFAASIAILALEVMHDLWIKSSISITGTKNN